MHNQASGLKTLHTFRSEIPSRAGDVLAGRIRMATTKTAEGIDAYSSKVHLVDVAKRLQIRADRR